LSDLRPQRRVAQSTVTTITAPHPPRTDRRVAPTVPKKHGTTRRTRTPSTTAPTRPATTSDTERHRLRRPSHRRSRTEGHPASDPSSDPAPGTGSAGDRPTRSDSRWRRRRRAGTLSVAAGLRQALAGPIPHHPPLLAGGPAGVPSQVSSQSPAKITGHCRIVEGTGGHMKSALT